MTTAAKSSDDPLRDVSPREFVGARNALAARLAKQGKVVEARQVRRLRRPSPVVWALNRTAVARSRELNALADAVDRLRRAQLGQGDLRNATERYRATFERLVRTASEVLADAGSLVSPALERRIRGTLLASVTDRRLRADLAVGRLTDEHAEPGFAVLTGGPIPADFLLDRPAKARPAPARPTPGQDAAEPSAAPEHRPRAKPRAELGRADKRERAKVRRQALQEARDARQAARKAERDARALERDARQKERAAQALEKQVEAARTTLRDLEQRGAALRTAADTAREAHEAADARARAASSRSD
jgi:hypothetical protein